MLGAFAGGTALLEYNVGGSTFTVTSIGVVIGVVIIVFALLDILPRFKDLAFDRKYLPLGGALSGFFGGLSGNQGALRSAFLIKAGLDKEAFLGTGTVSSIVVDVARLSVYGLAFYTAQFADLPDELAGLAIAAMLSAFIGSFIGSRLVKKVTLRSVQVLVGAMLIVVGAGLAIGAI